MKEILDHQPPLQKVYKSKVFWTGTFLFGPLASGYFFARNFRALGQPEYIQGTWIISIVTSIIVFTSVMMIPESVNFPEIIVPIVYTSIAWQLFKQYQEKSLEKHLEAGGETFSWWNVIGMGLVFLLITLVLVILIVVVIDLIAPMSLEDY